MCPGPRIEPAWRRGGGWGWGNGKKKEKRQSFKKSVIKISSNHIQQTPEASIIGRLSSSWWKKDQSCNVWTEDFSEKKDYIGKSRYSQKGCWHEYRRREVLSGYETVYKRPPSSYSSPLHLFYTLILASPWGMAPFLSHSANGICGKCITVLFSVFHSCATENITGGAWNIVHVWRKHIWLVWECCFMQTISCLNVPICVAWKVNTRQKF